MIRLVSMAMTAATLAVLPVAGLQVTPTALPPRLDHYVANVAKLTADERSQLLKGEPVAKLLDSDENKEVAVFAAIWMNVPVRRYLDAVSNIEQFESGGAFKVTKRISSPPRIEDFAQMSIPPDDVDDLRTCRVGNCKVKLGEEALNRFRTNVNWTGPNVQREADTVMRQLAFEYATRYLQGGNAQLAVYRDRSRPTFVTTEFKTMVDDMPELDSYIPDVRRYLLEFPKQTLPGAQSFLYWQEVEFGLKPTIRVSHLTIKESPEGGLVVSKMLYASHYFWTGLELRALVPDPARGPGFWLVTVNRSRSDGLDGFTGVVVRPLVRNGVQTGSLNALNGTKKALEGR